MAAMKITLCHHGTHVTKQSNINFLFSFQAETSPEQDSTWKNVLSKLKMMAPYVWPKGSWWRQLIVLACLILLGAGRGINVLVPLYNKYIGMFNIRFLNRGWGWALD